MIELEERRRRRDFTRPQLSLIRKTIARTCTDLEFDQYIEVARGSGLDPLRRQIAPLIMHPTDPEKRRLVPWATIDGLRVIAARCGDYRPMEGVPTIEQDEALRNLNTNPLGIRRAEVRVWKYREGAWFPVVGEAWWEEHAPLRGVGEHATLDASWLRMPRVMIVKCAEALALRRGWPDLLSGLYGEEELHALKRAEETASEAAHRTEQGVVTQKCNERSIWFVFDPSAGLETVPIDIVAQRLSSFYEASTTKKAIETFHARNRESLNLFWDWRPREALTLKELSESRLADLSRTPSEARGSRAQIKVSKGRDKRAHADDLRQTKRGARDKQEGRA